MLNELDSPFSMSRMPSQKQKRGLFFVSIHWSFSIHKIQRISTKMKAPALILQINNLPGCWAFMLLIQTISFRSRLILSLVVTGAVLVKGAGYNNCDVNQYRFFPPLRLLTFPPLTAPLSFPSSRVFSKSISLSCRELRAR